MSRAELAFQAFLDLVQEGKEPSREEYLNSCDLSIRDSLQEKLDEYFSLTEKFQKTPAAPKPGAFLGDFRLGREIGRGGMGVVWEAEQLSVHRRVAVKILYPIYSISSTILARFQREAAAAGRIDDPSVVKVITTGEDEGTHFLAMELVPNSRTLEASFEDGSVQKPASAEDIHTCANFFTKLASGLAAAHRAGVIHRDFKPGNILIEKNGNPKIVDFGLARLEGAILFTQPGTQTGTPCFMSPEQVNGQSNLAFSTDIFSFGATLYQALTGKRPFDGVMRERVLLKILNEDPPTVKSKNSAVPRDLSVICMRCLDKDPEHRFQCAEELAEELERFLEGAPILSRPPGPIERTWRWAQRNRAMTAFLVSICGGLFISSLMIFQIKRGLQTAERAIVSATKFTSLMDPDRRLDNRENSVIELNKLKISSEEFFSRNPLKLSQQLLRIGVALRYQGEWQSSSDCLESALENLKDLETEHDQLELDIKLNLAWSMTRISIKETPFHSRAIQLATEVMNNSDSEIPEESWRAVASWNRLGAFALDIGNTEEALNWFMKVEDWRILNPSKHQMLMNLNCLDLAVLALRRQEHERAVAIGKRALQQYKRDAGNLHTEVGYSHWALASAFHLAKEDGLAREHLEKALASFVPLLGENHPQVQETLVATENWP